MPTPILSSIFLLEFLFHSKPNYLFLKIFGCLCFPYLKPYRDHKFDFKSDPCTFTGYVRTKVDAFIRQGMWCLMSLFFSFKKDKVNSILTSSSQLFPSTFPSPILYHKSLSSFSMAPSISFVVPTFSCTLPHRLISLYHLFTQPVLPYMLLINQYQSTIPP